MHKVVKHLISLETNFLITRGIEQLLTESNIVETKLIFVGNLRSEHVKRVERGELVIRICK